MASASRWRVQPLVEIALRDGAGIPELLAAVELALGERDARLRRRDLRLGALDLGRIRRRIDGDQEIALLDQRAFAEMHGLHGAGDARAHFDPLDRLQPAGELVPQCDVALLDHRDRTGVGGGSAAGVLERELLATLASAGNPAMQEPQAMPAPNSGFET